LKAYACHAKTLLGEHEICLPFETRDDALMALIEAHEQSTIALTSVVEQDIAWRAAGCALARQPLSFLHSCDETSSSLFAARRSEIPNPLGNECGNCEFCKPWLDLAIYYQLEACENEVLCFTAQVPPLVQKPVKAKPVKQAPADQADANPTKEPKKRASRKRAEPKGRSSKSSANTDKSGSPPQTPAASTAPATVPATAIAAAAIAAAATVAPAVAKKPETKRPKPPSKAKSVAKKAKFVNLGDADMDEFFQEFLA
jgi:hypothetical protein